MNIINNGKNDVKKIKINNSRVNIGMTNRHSPKINGNMINKKLNSLFNKVKNKNKNKS